MKKGLLGLSALIFAAALVGCGADKEKASDKETASSKAETTVAEETAAENKTEETNNEGSTAKDADPEALKALAGPYHYTGYMTMGNVPDELDPKKLNEQYKDDPISISEDGVLHLYGKDYQLVAEGMKDEDTVFSIEGSGFDMESYRKSSKASDKDYEGPCALVVQVSHMTVNDVDVPYTQYNVLLTQKGDEDYFGYVGIDEGEKSDWDWDWDDDDSDDDWDLSSDDE
jgi:hypothetical protein